ncbi:MAG: hypothetical protein ACT4QE_14970 [Anaerolineales bacterium]
MWLIRISLCSFVPLLVMCLAACTPANPTPRADGVILQDDFSDPASGWDRHSAAEIVTDYVDGQYRVEVGSANLDAWGLAGLDLNDVQVEAEARYAAGPLDNSYGLLCRYTRADDKSSFYFFLVSSDGYYAMGKVVRNIRTYLNPNKNFEPLAAVQTDKAAVNVLAMTCRDDQFTFVVNGQPAGAFTDAELTHGDVGLMVSTLTEGGVKIHFDNAVIRQP